MRGVPRFGIATRELYAASAKEKAIACLSTVARCRRNSKVRSDGNGRAQRKTLGIPAERLAAFQPLSPIHSLTHLLPLRSALLLGKAIR